MLASAGVRDCSDVVSCALAAVAASANVNAVANLDMTGSFAHRTNARRHDSVSIIVEEELGAKMATI